MSSDVLTLDLPGPETATMVRAPSDVLVFDAPVQAVVLAPDGCEVTETVMMVELPGDLLLIDAPALTEAVQADDTATELLVIDGGIRGPRGRQGLKGDTGDDSIVPGPQGLSGGSFVFYQASAADTWVIDYDLGYVPNVMVVDWAGTVMVGAVRVTGPSELTIYFNMPVSGTAYLS